MTNETRRKGLVVGVASAGVIVGVIAGFFAAHLMIGHMSDTKGLDVKDKKAVEGTQAASPAPGEAVAIPTVARQLIGVRSAPAAYASLEQEIRTVGTVDYNERGLTQVTLKVSGWVQQVFVNSTGRPVRRTSAVPP